MPMTAVLTGDLIRSTSAEAGALDRSMTVIRSALADMTAPRDAGQPVFQRYRGDGWQAAMTDHARALRAALGILARLRADPGAIATRVFIATGEAPPLTGTDLSAMTGEAFVTSGRGLDRLGSSRILGIGGAGIGPLHQIIVELIEQHVLKWTREQAEAAALALRPDSPTLAQMGEVLGITPQAVNYRLNGGAVQAIRHALQEWEDAWPPAPAPSCPSDRTERQAG